MDRISAIRNVEDALRAFENGDADLVNTERRVAAVLRTYATEFEGEDDVFRAVGEEPADGRIVVASSKPAARERVLRLSGIDPDDRSLQTGGNTENNRDNTGNLTGSKNDAVPDFDIERV
ncbi:hypothetical protein [Halorubrum trueperi]|uniref:Uncharacterized protein n=1 Tax=Halorubrum trueperi TaxID=2004704 RepID=A0ABD5UQG3_9EURY